MKLDNNTGSWKARAGSGCRERHTTVGKKETLTSRGGTNSQYGHGDGYASMKQASHENKNSGEYNRDDTKTDSGTGLGVGVAGIKIMEVGEVRPMLLAVSESVAADVHAVSSSNVSPVHSPHHVTPPHFDEAIEKDILSVNSVGNTAGAGAGTVE